MNRKKQIYTTLAVCAVAVSAMTQTAAASEETTAETVISQYRACEHSDSYVLQDDSYEATETTGGLRHYKCTECDAEYSYETDPTVYVDGFVKQDGTVVDVNEGNEGASNPLFPSWEHVPDGEPHVWWSRDDLEWRVYITGSHDMSGTDYCGTNHVIWSAPVYDMSEWRLDGTILDLTEEGGNPFGASKLFAPDSEYDVTTDRYFLIDNEIGGTCSLRSTDNPAGPYDTNQVLWEIPSGCSFDPAIYIENGTIYILTSSGTSSIVSDTNKEIFAAYGAEEVVAQAAEDGYESSILTLYQLGKNEQAGEGGREYTIADVSFCPIDGKSYFPIYEGPSLPGYIEELEKYVLLYVTYEIGFDGTWQNSGIGYAWSDDLMNGEWHYGENGVDDILSEEEYPEMAAVLAEDTNSLKGRQGNIISDTSGRYQVNQETGEMEFTAMPTYLHGNNHGGIVKANGEWYFFGHRQTGTTMYSRQACGGQIEVYTSEDGEPVITPMEFTSSGVADSLDAYTIWDADITTYLCQNIDTPTRTMESGQATSFNEAEEGSVPYIVATRFQDWVHATYITNISNGNVVGYKYLDFGDEATNVTLKMLLSQPSGWGSSSVDGIVRAYLDSPDASKGTLLTEIEISAEALEGTSKATGSDGTRWSWASGDSVTEVSGVHAVYFVFGSEEEGTICKFDQFGFEVAE